MLIVSIILSIVILIEAWLLYLPLWLSILLTLACGVNLIISTVQLCVGDSTYKLYDDSTDDDFWD